MMSESKIVIIKCIENRIRDNLDYNNFCNLIDYTMLCYYISWIDHQNIDSAYYFNLSKKCFEYIIDNMKKFNVLLGSLYGFTTLLYLSNVLEKNHEYNYIKETIYKFIEEYIHNFYMIKLYKSGLKTSVYDLVNGMSGVGIALINTGYNGKVLNDITDYIIVLFKKSHFVIKKGNITNPYFYYTFKYGYIDLGTAHGIISCYAYLTLFKTKNDDFKKKELKKILKYIFDIYFTATKVSFLHNSLLPQCIIVNENNERFQYFYDKRMSWCYGSLNIYIILYNLSKDKKSYSVNLFIKQINYIIENTKVDDYDLVCPTFCHGLSGLYYIVNELCKMEGIITNYEMVNKLSDELENQIWEKCNHGYTYFFCKTDYSRITKNYMYDELNISYLSGVVSIIIPLILKYYNLPEEKNIFKKILML